MYQRVEEEDLVELLPGSSWDYHREEALVLQLGLSSGTMAWMRREQASMEAKAVTTSTEKMLHRLLFSSCSSSCCLHPEESKS